MRRNSIEVSMARLLGGGRRLPRLVGAEARETEGDLFDELCVPIVLFSMLPAHQVSLLSSCVLMKDVIHLPVLKSELSAPVCSLLHAIFSFASGRNIMTCLSHSWMQPPGNVLVVDAEGGRFKPQRILGGMDQSPCQMFLKAIVSQKRVGVMGFGALQMF